MLIERLTSWVRARFAGPEVRAVEQSAPVVKQAPATAEAPFAEPPVVTRVETKPPAAPERPQSAVELLRNEPNLDAATLAARAGVTLSYARSLIRRRKAKALLAPARPVRPAPAAASFMQTQALLQTQVADLARRLDNPGESIAKPPALLSRRTQVLDRSAAGIGAKRISEELAMPMGEVDFILKVEQLKKSLKN
ncbi:MAG TPA: hypothetical protein VEX68_21220 [Bryobacteraceae bacterium]|nr:hypothetical protein [Bryobacteraceae bacterium]